MWTAGQENLPRTIAQTMHAWHPATTSQDNETRHHRHLPPPYDRRLRIPILSVVRDTMLLERLIPPVLRSKPWAPAANR
jgi:hypothetical protein